MTTLITSHAERATSRGRRPAERASPADACASAAPTPSWSPHVVGAALGALGLVWLVYERLLPMTGAIGFWLCWYVAFLVLLAADQRDHPRPGGGRRPAGRRAGHARPALILVACLVGIVVFTVGPRLEALSHLNFYTADHGVHRPGGAARPGRHRRRHGRHPRAGGDLGGHQRAARHRHRGLPQRGARPARPDRAHRRRGDERRPDDRGRPVHLLDADPQVRPGAQRLRGVAGPVREHDPGRHHDRRGRAAAGAQRPARGVAGARAPRSGRPSAASCCRPRGPAWSPPCSSASPG